jgi:hypothetical protein
MSQQNKPISIRFYCYFGNLVAEKDVVFPPGTPDNDINLAYLEWLETEATISGWKVV